MPSSAERKSSKPAKIQSRTLPPSSIGRVIRMIACYSRAMRAPNITPCTDHSGNGEKSESVKIAGCDTSLGRHVRAGWGPKKGRRKVKGVNIGLRRKTHPRRRPAQSEAFPRVCTLSGRTGHRPRGPANGAPLTCLQRTHTVRVEGWLLVSASRCAAGSSLVAHPHGAAAAGQFLEAGDEDDRSDLHSLRVVGGRFFTTAAERKEAGLRRVAKEARDE